MTPIHTTTMERQWLVCGTGNSWKKNAERADEAVKRHLHKKKLKILGNSLHDEGGGMVILRGSEKNQLRKYMADGSKRNQI